MFSNAGRAFQPQKARNTVCDNNIYHYDLHPRGTQAQNGSDLTQFSLASPKKKQNKKPFSYPAHVSTAAGSELSEEEKQNIGFTFR